MVCVLQRDIMVMDVGCDLASTLCKHDLKKGDLFILRLARARRLMRGGICTEQVMCLGGVGSICYCLLWLDA